MTFKLGSFSGAVMNPATYWSGDSLVKLTSSNVSASWGRKQAAIDFSNKVFATWQHDARAVRRANASKARKTLEDMGFTRGWFAAVNPMMSIKTMWDAFSHFAGNNGKWTDNNFGNYNGGSFGGLMTDAPWCLCTFAHAYDANLNKIAELARKQQEAVQGLKRGIEGRSTVEWSTINEPLKKFDEYTKAIEPLMVMCPESKIKMGWDYTKTLGKYVGAMDDLMSELRKSGDLKTSAGVTALAFIVSTCVPVFGDLYAEAIKGLPNAIRFFENIKYERNHMMAQVYGSQYRMYER